MLHSHLLCCSNNDNANHNYFHLPSADRLHSNNSITDQSSTLNPDTGPQKAVDGIVNTGDKLVGCSHTEDILQEMSWWRIILDKPAFVRSVILLLGNINLGLLKSFSGANQ